MIGILNYEMGNVKSVANAVEHLGFRPVLVDDAAMLTAVSHLILPGVGAFAAAMRQLHQRSLVAPVRQFADSGRPLLGICLGMQLLASGGDEGGGSDGLGLIPGHVTRMQPVGGLPLPHVGWNDVVLQQAHPLFEGLSSGLDFYFVHSYHFETQEADDRLATTDYGGTVAAVVGRRNLVGVQFHPEKSQGNGLQLLAHFCRWDGR